MLNAVAEPDILSMAWPVTPIHHLSEKYRNGFLVELVEMHGLIAVEYSLQWVALFCPFHEILTVM